MTTPPVPKKSYSNLILGSIVLCAFCCAAFNGIRFIGSLRQPTPVPPQNTPPTPASQLEIGATVEYSTPEATATPAPTEGPRLGTSRTAPFPAGSHAEIGGDMILTVTSVMRPADSIVRDGNMFNDTPEPDGEYLQVTLYVECMKSTDEQCSFSTGSIKVVGVDGVIHDDASVAGIPGEMERYNEFFGGGGIAGNLIFYVKQRSPMVLFYEPLLFGDPVYIALQ